MVYIWVIITHITHHKSCWTFYIPLHKYALRKNAHQPSRHTFFFDIMCQSELTTEESLFYCFQPCASMQLLVKIHNRWKGVRKPGLMNSLGQFNKMTSKKIIYCFENLLFYNKLFEQIGLPWTSLNFIWSSIKLLDT